MAITFYRTLLRSLPQILVGNLPLKKIATVHGGILFWILDNKNKAGIFKGSGVRFSDIGYIGFCLNLLPYLLLFDSAKL
jgi:hypothetical protein